MGCVNVESTNSLCSRPKTTCPPHRYNFYSKNSGSVSSSSVSQQSAMGVKSRPNKDISETSFSTLSSTSRRSSVSHEDHKKACSNSLSKAQCTVYEHIVRAFLSVCSSRSSNSSISLLRWTLVVLVIVSIHVSPVSARYRTRHRGILVCRGIPCANGGILRLSNSIWGDCRCQCPSGFVGPFCQYQAARKRNVEPEPRTNRRRLSRSELLSGIRERLIAIRNRIDEEDERARAVEEEESNSISDQPTTIDTFWSDQSVLLRPRRSRPLTDIFRRR